MSEGSLDGLPHGGSVLDFRAKAPGSPEVHQALLDEQSQTPGTSSPTGETIPWLARLTLGLPHGVTRHPTLLDRVRDELGRPCAIDIAHTGIAVSYTAQGETLAQASDDSMSVCTALTKALNLKDNAIEEHVLIPADELPTWALFHRANLQPLPDK